jgi:hypothetical protein
MRRRLVALAALVGAGLLQGPASADLGLLVGVSDDTLKWAPAEATRVLSDLGLEAVRVTLGWQPGQTRLTGEDAAVFDRLVPAAFGTRVVVAVYGAPDDAPTTAEQRDQYCEYVGDFLTRYPSINDIVVWNEPNLSYFWRPQFDRRASVAPAAYAALLARCWDALHGLRDDVNVISNTSPRGNDRPTAKSNISHSPATFIRQIGAAYRASGRRQPIFDTVGHHVYGFSSSEPPSKRHPGSPQIGQGDLDKLLKALGEAFAGTGQPTPGRCDGNRHCVGVWYLEAGYQTVPDVAKAAEYVGWETDRFAVPAVAPQARKGKPAADQATQLTAGIRLAYCQPYVDAFFNFLLRDDRNRRFWQSGILWADGTPKPSYDALRAVVAEVRERRVRCG